MRHAVADRNLRRAAASSTTRPAVTLSPSRRRVSPGKFRAFQHTNRVVLAFHLIHLLPVDRNEPAHHHRNQTKLLAHARLVREERFHPVDLFAAHVHQKYVRQFWRSRFAQIE